MAGVFISYRREDAPGHAGRVYDRMRARFGADVVFMDVTALDAGADFVEAIEQAVGSCDVLLAIIGPQWVGAKDNAGRRRLENPTDFNRLEIAGALKRNVRVVPVLVDDATLPAPADLPDDLQPLLRRNAVELRDARWDADIDQLIASLDRIVKGPEPPLRLERSASRRLRWIAALVVLSVSAGAAAVFGSRGCAPAQDPVNVTKTTLPANTPRATTPSLAAQPSAAATKAAVPDVVGKSLVDARELLRRAGVPIARVLYRDDRTKAVDLVVLQNEARTSAGSPPAVALTVVASAAVMIQHTPQDAAVARGLLGALMSSPATAGLAMRTFETPVVRENNAGRVSYSDAGLASMAAGVAKDATAWLEQNAPGRPALTTAVSAPVVSRTLIIGLPDRAGTTASTGSATLPDVRGLGLVEARRTLTAAGVTVFDYKWSLDPGRKALEVFGQQELKGRAAARTVLLLVNAKGTLWLYRTDKTSPLADRFARELQQSQLDTLGILLLIVRQSTVPPETLGKVQSGDTLLSREARAIAAFATSWLAKEAGRTERIQGITGAGGDPRRLTFGLPPLE